MKENKRIYTLAIIVLLGVFLTWSLIGFLTSFLSALIIYILCKPLVIVLIERWKWHKGMAAFAAMFISFIVLLGPVWTLYGLLSAKLNYALTHSEELIAGLRLTDQYVFEKSGFRILSEDMLIKIRELATTVVPEIIGATANMLATMGMMYFMLYYMLVNTGKVEDLLSNALPLKSAQSQVFAKELQSAVFSNVMGAPVLAILQGLLAGLGFWVFGLDEPWFWGVITGFMSFIPVVGTAAVWIPAGIYQLVNGTTLEGWGILIFGLVVITNVDNVVRFTLQKKFADVHPMITVLGVIVGLKWFGITGIIFGPLLISYFLLMIKMYREEYDGK